MNSVTAAARIKRYATLPYYIFHSHNARSQKLMYVNLKSKFISLGKSVLPPATFLRYGIKMAHILHLRDYRHSSIIVVLVYEIYSYFKDSAFTAVIDGFSSFHEECMFSLTFVDLDECQSPDACGANGVCNNTIGSYRCECANGFVADSGAQDPLNPVCIGKKMDNQKKTEKRGPFEIEIVLVVILKFMNYSFDW